MRKPYRRNSGIFWVKGSVPAEVQALPGYGGPKQFHHTLGTPDPKEAEAALARVLLGLHGEWKALLAPAATSPHLWRSFTSV